MTTFCLLKILQCNYITNRIKLFNYIIQPWSLNEFKPKRYNNSRPVELACSVYKPEIPKSMIPILICHGMLGSKQNWRSLGKAIAKISQRNVYTLDARNHGDSPHTEDYTYHLMAEDIKYFMKSHNIPEAVVVGHSMGGRTSMYLTLTNEKLVNKLVVVDVGPFDMPHESTLSHGYMLSMKEALNLFSSASLVQARQLIDHHLSKTIPEGSVRQFLLTNLAEKNKKVIWKPNLETLLEKFETAVLKFPKISGYYSKDTLFICGGNSTYVRPNDHQDIKKLFPKAEFTIIPGAGHWVHSERPSEFLDALCKFIE